MSMNANIFLGENELKMGVVNGAPLGSPTTGAAHAITPFYSHLVSLTNNGLFSLPSLTADSTDVTTGEAIAHPTAAAGAVVPIFAAAGTYTVGVRYKYTDFAPGQKIFAKERHLWVMAIGF